MVMANDTFGYTMSQNKMQPSAVAISKAPERKNHVIRYFSVPSYGRGSYFGTCSDIYNDLVVVSDINSKVFTINLSTHRVSEIILNITDRISYLRIIESFIFIGFKSKILILDLNYVGQQQSIPISNSNEILFPEKGTIYVMTGRKDCTVLSFDSEQRAWNIISHEKSDIISCSWESKISLVEKNLHIDGYESPPFVIRPEHSIVKVFGYMTSSALLVVKIEDVFALQLYTSTNEVKEYFRDISCPEISVGTCSFVAQRGQELHVYRLFETIPDSILPLPSATVNNVMIYKDSSVILSDPTSFNAFGSIQKLMI
jgi:hypothetical protein